MLATTFAWHKSRSRARGATLPKYHLKFRALNFSNKSHVHFVRLSLYGAQNSYGTLFKACQETVTPPSHTWNLCKQKSLSSAGAYVSISVNYLIKACNCPDNRRWACQWCPPPWGRPQFDLWGRIFLWWDSNPSSFRVQESGFRNTIEGQTRLTLMIMIMSIIPTRGIHTKPDLGLTNTSSTFFLF